MESILTMNVTHANGSSLLLQDIYSPSLIVDKNSGGVAIRGPSVPIGNHAVRAYIVDNFLRYAAAETWIEKIELNQPSAVVGDRQGQIFATQNAVLVIGKRGTVFTVYADGLFIGTLTITDDAPEEEIPLTRALVEDEVITVSDGVGFSKDVTVLRMYPSVTWDYENPPVVSFTSPTSVSLAGQHFTSDTEVLLVRGSYAGFLGCSVTLVSANEILVQVPAISTFASSGEEVILLVRDSNAHMKSFGREVRLIVQ